MEPKIVEMQAIQLVGVVHQGKPDQLNYSEIWSNEYMPHDEEIKPFSTDQAYYGAWFGTSDPETPEYLAGMAVSGLDEPDESLHKRTIPAGTFAVFPCSMSTIAATYAEIFQTWLPASGYQYDCGSSDYEFYPAGSEAGKTEAFIYIPISPKM
ncbi:MAG: GyrI-like domain-containing protein [Anaerolineae bacterium]|nr:GyrI-like domain-containing protein [Anaerolineae bacterium]